MDKARKCFMCYKVSALDTVNEKETVVTGQLFETEENALLKSQLHVMLLLRKFLAIPQEGCCSLLRNYGNPCSWIYWCDSCSVVVNEAEETFHQMKLMERKLEKLQQKLKATIIQSEYMVDSSLVVDQFQNRATEIVRAYVTQKGENFVNVGVEVKIEIPSDEEELSDRFDNPLSPMENISDGSHEDFPSEPTSTVRPSENVRKTPSSIRRSSRKPKLSRVKVESLETVEDFAKEGHPSRNQRKGKKVRKAEDGAGYGTDNSDKSSNENFMHNSGSDGEYKPRKHSRSPRKKSNEIKSEENEYSCSSCGKSFESSSLLKLHEHRVHKIEKRFKCKYCNKKFRHNYETQHHERKHTGERPYKCSQCTRAFTNPKLLRQHNKTHTGEKPFKCSFCEKAFPRKAEWQKHELRHTGEKNFVCDQCGKAFSRGDSLKKHEELFHSGETHKCTKCEKTFPTAGLLKLHSKRHDNDLLVYSCEFCPKIFKDKRELVYHIRTHTGERPHECSLCPKKFTNPKTLRQHMKIHSGEKPFACTECDKEFTRKGELQKHLMLHTGEKPHLCQSCGRRFRALNTLKLHQKVHSENAGHKHRKPRNMNVVEMKEWPDADGKRYKCSFCGKPFNHRNDFLKHTRSHTGEKPYPCNLCDKQFTVLANLRIHLRSHTGEQPYSCEQCDKKFSCYSSMYKHRQVHSTEKPFACSHCDKKFRQKHGLQKHVITHHAPTQTAYDEKQIDHGEKQIDNEEEQTDNEDEQTDNEEEQTDNEEELKIEDQHETEVIIAKSQNSDEFLECSFEYVANVVELKSAIESIQQI